MNEEQKCRNVVSLLDRRKSNTETRENELFAHVLGVIASGDRPPVAIVYQAIYADGRITAGEYGVSDLHRRIFAEDAACSAVNALPVMTYKTLGKS